MLHSGTQKDQKHHIWWLETLCIEQISPDHPWGTLTQAPISLEYWFHIDVYTSKSVDFVMTHTQVIYTQPMCHKPSRRIQHSLVPRLLYTSLCKETVWSTELAWNCGMGQRCVKSRSATYSLFLDLRNRAKNLDSQCNSSPRLVISSEWCNSLGAWQ